MAQPAPLITLGIGPGGSVKYLLTGGLDMGAIVAAVAQPDGPHGPGFRLFEHEEGDPNWHPPYRRKREWERREERILEKARAAKAAADSEDRSELVKTARELKREVADLVRRPPEEDARLASLAENLKQVELANISFAQAVERIERAIAGWEQEQERDDMEAISLIMELV